MEFFYPIGKNAENQPVLELLPDGYKFAANIFYPFVKMPNSRELRDNAQLNNQFTNEDILRFGEPVSWEEIRKRSGLGDVSEVSIALIAYITGGGEDGRKIYQRPDLVKIMNESLDVNIFHPNEDEISVLLIKNILSVLGSNGAKRVKYTTLYGEQGTHKIKDITFEKMLSLCTTLITISDENEDFVFTCYFDEVTAIFFAKEDCRELLIKNGFEGIIFGKKTPLVWEDVNYTLLK